MRLGRPGTRPGKPGTRPGRPGTRLGRPGTRLGRPGMRLVRTDCIGAHGVIKLCVQDQTCYERYNLRLV